MISSVTHSELFFEKNIQATFNEIYVTTVMTTVAGLKGTNVQ